mmetsp:Transcript_13428/g.49933  ORF Transcript_13428/g.49933 Transcript_13428/m.49933 type:complete len:95 (+) Transcript_13428:511-795(+)|eukprot:scaffold698_cov397-Pinguiococcus_pyrenoidosus.AAC.8
MDRTVMDNGAAVKSRGSPKAFEALSWLLLSTLKCTEMARGGESTERVWKQCPTSGGTESRHERWGKAARHKARALPFLGRVSCCTLEATRIEML